MAKVLWVLLGIVCLAAVILGIVMTIMAVQFMEFGRMIFYGAIAIFGCEGAILAFLKLKKTQS